ncbi:TetR/AcrR family transcriptional regulator [Streptomyces sp. NPDC056948]|uniref:TetR/AcrR family transcriptional regulator n=1 Tax=Streptomyces sp. NPDC056948 TaxID=3345975 RepID=UPI00363EC6D7
MTEAGATKTPRERYRAQVRTEVKEHAWEQIATAGASALSLNAIAKRMGMSGPALYRYFAGRDELITELVTDAYRSLAGTFRAASGAGADVAALGHALRGWALEDPQRYLLIYGTPVPGYHAPDDVTAISSEIMATLLDACAALPRDSEDSAATPLDAHLEDHRDWADGHPARPAALRRALAFWTRLHGVLSLELSGHFTGMGIDPAQLFAAELDALSRPD